MAVFDLDDYTARLIACFPSPWARDGLKPGGGMYSVLRGTAAAYVKHAQQRDYIDAEKRIATAPDNALDSIAVDYFGPTYTRGIRYTGTDLVPESGPEFSARIRSDLIGPRQTIAAIQQGVSNYILNFFVAAEILNIRLLGLDTPGGLDTIGALDGRPTDVPPIPSVHVFDRQSNRRLADQVGLTPSQFCVLFTYGGLKRDGLFLRHSHIGKRDSHLINPRTQITAAPTPQIDVIVQSIKAAGTVQIYADNRGA